MESARGFASNFSAKYRPWIGTIKGGCAGQSAHLGADLRKRPTTRKIGSVGFFVGFSWDLLTIERACVPVNQVVPFASNLDWPTLGAIPVMLLTANGSLDVGLDAKAGQTLLVHGGTSSIGMLTAVLAKRLNMTVLSSTRNPAKAKSLDDVGVDHVVIDDGSISGAVRQLYPDGVDGALELVGTPTLPDTLRCVRVHGVACFTGILSNQWTVEKYYPIDYIPRGVRLTAYSGDAADLPPMILQSSSRMWKLARSRFPSATYFVSRRSSRATKRWRAEP